MRIKNPSKDARKGIVPWNKGIDNRPVCLICGEKRSYNSKFRCKNCVVRKREDWKCLDCGQELRHYRSKRCRSCAQVGNKNRFIDGGYSTNPRAYMNKYLAKWRKENKEKVIFAVYKSRIKRRGADGTYSLKEWKELKCFFDNLCLSCEKQEPDIKLTQDHIAPLVRGGDNYIGNIQPLCRGCNSRKHDKTIDYREGFVLC